MARALRHVTFLALCGSLFVISDQKCPAGYNFAFDGSCYMFSHDAEPWTGALVSCQLLDGYLLEINTPTELTFLRNTLVKLTNESRWIGISNKRRQSEWEWATSRTVFDNSFALWSPGEPDSYAGDRDESCGLLDYLEKLHHVYSLADAQCDRLQKYACEASQQSLRTMLPKDSHKRAIVNQLSQYIPSFTDIFDEESFYIFVFFLVIVTIGVAIFLAKRIEIKDAGHMD